MPEPEPEPEPENPEHPEHAPSQPEHYNMELILALCMCPGYSFLTKLLLRIRFCPLTLFLPELSLDPYYQRAYNCVRALVPDTFSLLF